MNKVCSDVWTWTQMLKQCYFKLDYIKLLFICSQMAYSCCFSFSVNLDILDFLQRSFITLASELFLSTFFVKNRNEFLRKCLQNDSLIKCVNKKLKNWIFQNLGNFWRKNSTWGLYYEILPHRRSDSFSGP